MTGGLLSVITNRLFYHCNHCDKHFKNSNKFYLFFYGYCPYCLNVMVYTNDEHECSDLNWKTCYIDESDIYDSIAERYPIFTQPFFKQPLIDRKKLMIERHKLVHNSN
jgi:hypothetical protein